MKFRKAQEEMFGFALIVVLVMVAGLIFLSIGLANPGDEVKERQDIKVNNFLDAMLQYTTNYTSDSIPVDVQEMIQDCDSGKSLDGGILACDALNVTTRILILNSWCGSGQCSDKGYSFSVMSSSGSEIQRVDMGNQSKTSRGTTRAIPPSIEVKIIVYS